MKPRPFLYFIGLPFLLGMVIVLTAIVFGGGLSEQELKTQQDEYFTSAAQAIVDSKSIRYIYDERTGICFAYLWGGDYRGGPALAVVPYEAVKDHLVNQPENPPENRTSDEETHHGNE